MKALKGRLHAIFQILTKRNFILISGIKEIDIDKEKARQFDYVFRTDYSEESDFYTMKMCIALQFGRQVLDSQNRVCDYKPKN